MNLFYIANIRLPTEKAHGIQIMKMCEAFAKLGHKVELVVPNRYNEIEDNPYDYYGVKKIFSIKKLWCLDLVRMGRIGFLIQSLTFCISVLSLSSRREGVFYTRDELTAFLLNIFGKKVVWEVHMGQQNFFAKRLIKSHTPFVTITHKLKELYISYGKPENQLLVAHDAVDPTLFEGLPSKGVLRQELSIPENSIVVGYIGKFKTAGKSKGVEELVASFAKAYRENSQLLLLLVGINGDEVDEVQAIMKGEGLTAAAYILKGHMNQFEAIRYIKASDILVMNYPNTEHYAHYMSPLKLFEYMASGNPIISTDLPSIREVLDDDMAVFVEAGSQEDMRNGLLKLAFDKGGRSMLSKKAMEEVSKRTWEDRARKIISFSEF